MSAFYHAAKGPAPSQHPVYLKSPLGSRAVDSITPSPTVAGKAMYLPNFFVASSICWLLKPVSKELGP